MKEKVLFVILNQFADWECAFLTTALEDQIQDKTSPYEVKIVSISVDPVKSIGGFTVIPDYGINDCPTDYAGVILIGGTSWFTEEAKQIVPLLKDAQAAGKVIGGICSATVFLGMHGLLNENKHTSNTLESLSAAAKEQYTGSALYQQEQAVRDGNLITANGSAYLEFTREVLFALKAYPDEYIEGHYQFFREGYIAMNQNASEING